MSASSTDPLMLRVYKDDKKGATAFFRNRPFLTLMTALLRDMPQKPKVFFHASSIGAEPYSFAATMLTAGIDVSVEATDIEPDFIEHAKMGVYPADITTRMTDDEKRWFHPDGNGNVSIDDALRKVVNFLPAQSVTDPIGQYDAVFAMNVLTYLTPDGQTVAIKTMAKSAGKYLCLTAFHPETIKSDIDAIGFAPVLTDQEAIHNAWGDRVKEAAAITDQNKSWAVPAYNTDLADYQYRYGAIFKRL